LYILTITYICEGIFRTVIRRHAIFVTMNVEIENPSIGLVDQGHHAFFSRRFQHILNEITYIRSLVNLYIKIVLNFSIVILRNARWSIFVGGHIGVVFFKEVFQIRFSDSSEINKYNKSYRFPYKKWLSDKYSERVDFFEHSHVIIQICYNLLRNAEIENFWLHKNVQNHDGCPINVK